MVSDEDILITLAWSDWEPFFYLYKVSRKDQLYWRRLYWCFLTVWLEGTVNAMDLGLDARIFLVWIWGPSAVAGGAQVWLIVFLWGVCEPGPMIGLDKKWRSFCWFIFPILNEWGSSRMRGGIPLMYFSICTRNRSLQNIRQELWTPSLGYFYGSSSTFKY